MQSIIGRIVEIPQLHAKWLNTLSMMENAGAKKIKRCEHPIFVNEIILKHAAEEARHAYYLKKQISKILDNACPTYEKPFLLAPKYSYYYLHTLDISVSRYLKENYDLQGDKLKYAAYLLVTYAIEVRADVLYPLYQVELNRIGSKVNVKSIILEEINHLREIQDQLRQFTPHWETMCAHVRQIEEQLYQAWVSALNEEVEEELA